MIDEIINFYKFLGLNYDFTAAIAILHVIIIIFGLAFLAHFITKNYVIGYARKTILLKKNAFTESILEFKPFQNIAHLVSAITFYSLADFMTSDDARINWINESVELIEDGGIIYATFAVVWFMLAFLNECVWRTQSEEFWVNFKVWGLLPITFIFTAFQISLINKHKINE